MNIVNIRRQYIHLCEAMCIMKRYVDGIEAKLGC
jgi:hypothetical protein